VQLIAQAIRGARQLFAQFRIQPRQLAQLNDRRIVHLHRPKRHAIGLDGTRQDPRIAPIVLGTANGVPLAKPIQLFRIDGVDRKPALEQRLHDGTARHFDGNPDPARIRLAHRQEPVGQLVQIPTVMLDPPLGHDRPRAIKHTHLMVLTAAINTDRQRTRLSGHRASLVGIDGVLIRPCTGARSATPHGTTPSDSPAHRSVRGTRGSCAHWCCRREPMREWYRAPAPARRRFSGGARAFRRAPRGPRRADCARWGGWSGLPAPLFLSGVRGQDPPATHSATPSKVRIV
jgi:hypothetical protein